ncbi:hypothetical protein VYE96_04715 [Fusobacterium pseudoperiodonticum]|nr:hypothetical protein [Fusobacterium pseudoperiodonticum]
MIKEDYKSFLGGTFFSGNISVYDLRTGKKLLITMFTQKKALMSQLV